MTAQLTRIHGSCVAIGGAAVLLRGPPASGKSDLALRLIDRGAALVADDQVEILRDGARLFARCPAAIHGRIEVRGVGVAAVAALGRAPLALVVDLVAPERVARLPESARAVWFGLAVPCLALAPFEASAAAKVRIAVGTLGDHSMTSP